MKNREYTIDDINKRTVTVVRLLLLGGDYKAYMEALEDDLRAAVIEKLGMIIKKLGDTECLK